MPAGPVAPRTRIVSLVITEQMYSLNKTKQTFNAQVKECEAVGHLYTYYT